MIDCSFTEIATRCAVVSALSVSAGGLAWAFGGPVIETVGVVAATCLTHNVLQYAVIDYSLRNRIENSSFLFLTALSNTIVSEGASAAAAAYDVLGSTATIGLRAIGLSTSAYCVYEGFACMKLEKQMEKLQREKLQRKMEQLESQSKLLKLVDQLLGDKIE